MERSEAIFNLGSEVVMSAQCGNYDTLNYAIIQERLDRCLIDPINIMKNIITGKREEHKWEKSIESIKFSALRELGELIISLKRNTTGSNHINKKKDLNDEKYLCSMKEDLKSDYISNKENVGEQSSGFICKVQSIRINNSNYENLVSPSSATSLVDKINSYKKAIAIYPNRTDGYLRMLEAYEDEGKFGKEENDEFLALYNANKDKFDISSVAYAELNYKIGMMYFNYYSNENGSYEFSNRVQKAYSFFAANYENSNISSSFKEKSISDCYYQICFFYKKYILNSATVEEASKENYETLFETLRSALNDISSASPYDQLTLYNGIFMLLYDQQGKMVQVNVDKDEVLDLLDIVYNSAKALTVQKDQSKKLQEEIKNNYEIYRQAIVTTYMNAEMR